MANPFRSLAVVVTIGLLSAACSGGGYSRDLRSGFMNGCEPAAGSEYCECAFAEIERTFTEEEFIEMDFSFPAGTGEAPAALETAVEPCRHLPGG